MSPVFSARLGDPGPAAVVVVGRVGALKAGLSAPEPLPKLADGQRLLANQRREHSQRQNMQNVCAYRVEVTLTKVRVRVRCTLKV